MSSPGSAGSPGFFFGGIGPAFAEEGDAIVMQWLAHPVDPAKVATATPFVRELVDYVEADRVRVATS